MERGPAATAVFSQSAIRRQAAPPRRSLPPGGEGHPRGRRRRGALRRLHGGPDPGDRAGPVRRRRTRPGPAQPRGTRPRRRGPKWRRWRRPRRTGRSGTTSTTLPGGRNPAFAAAELGDRALERLRLDLVLFTGSDGGVVHRDLPPACVKQDGSRRRPSCGRWPGGRREPRLAVAGLLDTDSGPMVLAARRITRTDGSGTPPGFLVLARRLDPKRLSAELSVLPSTVLLLGSSLDPGRRFQPPPGCRAGQCARRGAPRPAQRRHVGLPAVPRLQR
jgi:hypothetical protein